MGIEEFDDFGEVKERTRQAIDLVDHHNVYLAGIDVGQQCLQPRSVHSAARESAIVILGAYGGPPFVPLAQDEGLARLSLRMEGIERLFEAFLRRLAGVDRAPRYDLSHRQHRLRPSPPL